jgi:hypothetical protein
VFSSWLTLKYCQVGACKHASLVCGLVDILHCRMCFRPCDSTSLMCCVASETQACFPAGFAQKDPGRVVGCVCGKSRRSTTSAMQLHCIQAIQSYHGLWHHFIACLKAMAFGVVSLAVCERLCSSLLPSRQLAGIAIPLPPSPKKYGALVPRHGTRMCFPTRRAHALCVYMAQWKGGWGGEAGCGMDFPWRGRRTGSSLPVSHVGAFSNMGKLLQPVSTLHFACHTRWVSLPRV